MKQLINKIGVSRILLAIACLVLLLALILTNTNLQAQQKYEQLFYKEDGTVIRVISDLKPGDKHACEYNYGDLVKDSDGSLAKVYAIADDGSYLVCQEKDLK